MGFYRGPNIVTNGLVLSLDAGNVKSYASGSTTWFDKSGNNNNGTLTNGPGYSSANGGSIVFDGVNDYCQFINPNILQLQNFSISLWVNPANALNVITSIIDYDHATAPVQGWVIQSEDATTNRYYYLAYYDGTQYQPSGSFGVGKGIQITNSIWQNLTYTKNGTSVIGYLNGIQTFISTAGNSNISYQSNKNLRIGNVVSTGSGVGNRSYNGRVSNTQAYNRALSAQEVLQNYNAIKSRFNLT